MFQALDYECARQKRQAPTSSFYNSSESPKSEISAVSFRRADSVVEAERIGFDFCEALVSNYRT